MAINTELRLWETFHVEIALSYQDVVRCEAMILRECEKVHTRVLSTDLHLYAVRFTSIHDEHKQLHCQRRYFGRP